MNNVLVLLRRSRPYFDVPAEGGEEGVDELAPDLGLVVGRVQILLAVARKALDELEYRIWCAHVTPRSCVRQPDQSHLGQVYTVLESSRAPRKPPIHTRAAKPGLLSMTADASVADLSQSRERHRTPCVYLPLQSQLLRGCRAEGRVTRGLHVHSCGRHQVVSVPCLRVGPGERDLIGA